MKAKLISLIALFLVVNAFSQNREIININNKTLELPPPYILDGQTSFVNEKYIKYNYYMNLARETFLKKEFDKTLYYLQYTKDVDSPEYWFYIAIVVLQEGSEDASKKYLKKGLMDLGCWECGVAFEKLFDEEIKYMHNLLRDTQPE